MIQVRGIRYKSYPKKNSKGEIVKDSAGNAVFEKYDYPLSPAVEAENLHALFDKYEEFVNKIPESERWNMFYTIGHMPETSDGKSRRWSHQEVIPFDIDNIHYTPAGEPHKDYFTAISEAIDVDLSKCIVVATGNGLQILVKPKQVINERDYFKKHEKYYLALSQKIAETLSKYGLTGSLDKSAFEPNRLFRLPGTLNKKPNRPERIAKLLNKNLVTCDWDLVTASGLPLVTESDAIEEKVIRRMRIDNQAVETGCEFLKWTKDSQNHVSEPQWYAMLSIVGRLNDGNKKAHEYSKLSSQYSPHETDTKVNQAINSSGPRTCDNINSLWGKCKTCPNYKKVTSPILLKGPEFISSLDSGFHAYNSKGQAFPQYEDLLKFYLQKRPFINVAKTHYIFESGIWVRQDDAHVKAFAQEHFDPTCNNNKANEFYGIVSRTNVESTEFFTETTKRKINFINGTLNLDTSDFSHHTTSHGFLWSLPFKYDPLAQAPLFEKFMHDFTEGDTQKQLILQEYMGYAISGDEPRAQKFLTLVGDGSNGKSTFIEILQTLVGGSQGKAYCALSLSDLSKQFERTMLMGALFNIIDESETYIDGSVWEKLKNLVTGGTVNAAFKGKDAFQFQNKAKFIMLVNDIPKGANPNKGFYRRFLIVPCTAVFEEKTADRFIKDKIVADELPGIMNYALRGYQRLIEQGYIFTHSEAAEAALKAYESESNSINEWCDTNLELGEPTSCDRFAVSNGSGRILTSIPKLRAEFNEWLEDRGEKALGETTFTKRLRLWLKTKGIILDDTRIRFKVDKKPVWALGGIRSQEDGPDDMPGEF